MDEGEEESKELNLNAATEDCREGPNEGEMFVDRRDLSSLVPQEKQEQRETIFHTRCTIRGKVSLLIIDGGSCTDVASCQTLNCSSSIPIHHSLAEPKGKYPNFLQMLSFIIDWQEL